jgi:hypothetical protein
MTKRARRECSPVTRIRWVVLGVVAAAVVIALILLAGGGEGGGGIPGY